MGEGAANPPPGRGLPTSPPGSKQNCIIHARAKWKYAPGDPGGWGEDWDDLGWGMGMGGG